MLGFKIISQYERGIVFRWGRALPGVREPGLTWVNPFTDRLRKVNMQIIAAAVPGQETITRDNVTLRVDAVVYYRVIDPLKAIVNVQNYAYAVSQVAQTSLRAVTGRSNMDELLSEREKVNAELPTRDRRAHRAALGRPRGAGRGQGRLTARVDETLDVAAGRSRARAARTDHLRRRRGIRRPGSSPRQRPSWPPTRRPCSFGCCRPSSRWPARRTAPW